MPRRAIGKLLVRAGLLAQVAAPSEDEHREAVEAGEEGARVRDRMTPELVVNLDGPYGFAGSRGATVWGASAGGGLRF